MELYYSITHLQKLQKNFKRGTLFPESSSRLISHYYLFKFTSSSSKESEVVIIRLFAWKPRCVVIISVNSADRSTLLISNTPDSMLPPSAVISEPVPSNSPEFEVAEYRLLPALARPEALAKFANASGLNGGSRNLCPAVRSYIIKGIGSAVFIFYIIDIFQNVFLVRIGTFKIISLTSGHRQCLTFRINV